MAIPAHLQGTIETDTGRAGGLRWLETTRQLYRYYCRDMTDARDQRRLYYPENHEHHIQRTVPWVWRVSRELGSLYLHAPSRRWIATDPAGGDVGEFAPGAAALAERVYRGAEVDLHLRQMHEVGVACGNSALLVWPMPGLRGARLVFVPPHEHSVDMGAEALSHDERDVAEWQVRLPVRRDPTTGAMEYGVVRITPTEAVWVSGALSGKSPWNENPDDISNPLGEVPAVVFRRSSPAAGEFWAQAPEDFLDAQRAINHDVTDQGTIARMQGFAQPVTKGLGKEEASKLQVGYEAIINLADPDSSFTFESPQPDLEGYRMQLRDYIRTVTAANGLNPGTVDKSTAVTALGKQYEMADRTIEQARHKVEFARVESRLYRLIRAWVNYYRAGSEPGDTAEVKIANGPLPKGRVDVEYREPWIAVDPLHDAQAMELRMSLGVSSRAVEVGRLNGWTLKEAEDWCEANPAPTVAVADAPA